MNPDRSRRQGFTLLELLATLGIIACLVGMTAPTVTKMRAKSASTACVANLRQIGLTSQLYAAGHDQNFPMIDAWPSNPIYESSDGVSTILESLTPYGLTAAAMKCSSDLAGPNYFRTEGSSYEWCPMANNQKITSPKLNFGGGSHSVDLSRLLVAFDYSAVHADRSNILFGDGHVQAGD